MLVLTRGPNQQTMIGNNVVMTVVRIEGNRVVLGFEAAKEIPIHRAEVQRRIQRDLNHEVGEQE